MIFGNNDPRTRSPLYPLKISTYMGHEIVYDQNGFRLLKGDPMDLEGLPTEDAIKWAIKEKIRQGHWFGIKSISGRVLA